MKEVISLQIGSCGNNIGTQFWEMICDEHNLDFTGIYHGRNPNVQLQKITSYFREVRGLQFLPRSIMIDLDNATKKEVKSSSYSSIFRQNNMVFGKGGTGTNWAKGHLTEGVDLKILALDVIRKEAERTDCLQAFQFLHSIGGGTGSGLGALLMNSIKDEYPGRNVSSFTVVPAHVNPNSGMEIYNSILALSHLIAQCDETFFMDNSALHKICLETPKLSNYSMRDLNGIIASAISGITTSMRFNGIPDVDFRKIAINFVPYPRMHFFAPSVAPLNHKQRSSTVREIVDQLFPPKKLFVDCDLQRGKFLTLAAFFRGDVCHSDAVQKFHNVINKYSGKFVEWVPDNVKTFTIPSDVLRVSATMIANTTGIQQMFRRLRDQFNPMFQRKAYLAPYKSEGIDEMDFEEALMNVSDIIDEYKENEGKSAD